MNPDAKWIWTGHAVQHQILLFRRDLSLAEFDEALLSITADSRYRLWVNQTWVGDGPARAYTTHYRYDIHDLSNLLREGENRIEIRVMHAGVSNFQYIHSSPGLLCSLQVDQEPTYISDEHWQVSNMPEYEPNTPQICEQLFHMECVDLRKQEHRNWKAPEILRSQHDDPHENLRERDSALLSRSPVVFQSFVSAATVKPPEHVFTFKTKRLFHPDSSSANLLPGTGCLFSQLHIERSGILKFQTEGMDALFLDGIEILSHPVLDSSEILQTFDPVSIQAGVHLLILKKNVVHFPPTSYLACHAGMPVTWQDPTGGSSGWAFSGPVWQAPEDTNQFEGFSDPLTKFAPFPQWLCPEGKLKDAQNLAESIDLETLIDRCPSPCGLDDQDLCACDPVVDVQFAEALQSAPSICSPENALHSDPSFTTIHPTPEGDAQLIYDLGGLSVGYFQLDIEAPKGTVVDAYFFEYMEAGQIQIPGAVRNGFRLYCREGHNHFSSINRLGMHFVILVFRDFTRPLKLNNIHLIESTYPTPLGMYFYCSDERFNQIDKISRRTLQLCMEDTFTDCPTYEQVLWIGDARSEARFAFSAFGAYDLAKRCCRLGAESLDNSPIVASQAPSGWNMLLPAWSFLWNINVWETYFYSGDPAFLGELYPAMRKNTDQALNHLDSRGLFSMNTWNMFDWANIDDRHKTVLHNSMFLVAALDAAIQAAEELGHAQDSARWKTSVERLKSSVNHCWSE